MNSKTKMAFVKGHYRESEKTAHGMGENIYKSSLVSRIYKNTNQKDKWANLKMFKELK